MIISDLKHFEEVVAEASRIIGGGAETLTVGQLFPEFASQLKQAGLSALLTTQLNVISEEVNTLGITTSATTATGTTPVGDQIEYSSSASSLMSN